MTHLATDPLSFYDAFVVSRWGSLALELNESAIVGWLVMRLQREGYSLRCVRVVTKWTKFPYRIGRDGVESDANARWLGNWIKEYFSNITKIQLGPRTSKIRFWVAIGEQVAVSMTPGCEPTEAMLWLKTHPLVQGSPCDVLTRDEVFQRFLNDTKSTQEKNVWSREFREACRCYLLTDPFLGSAEGPQRRINGKQTRVFLGLAWKEKPNEEPTQENLYEAA